MPTLAAPGPGLELEVGGPGTGQGKLGDIKDITFDAQNNLYVLDGADFDNKQKRVVGNLLVQKFTNDGKFISQFSIAGQGRDQNHLPQRMAVDEGGDIYITVPGANEVERYDAQGKLKQSYPVDGAMGITTWRHDGKQRIAVIGGVRQRIDRKWGIAGGEQIVLIDPAGQQLPPIKLNRAMENVLDLASGPNGNFYILAGLTIQIVDAQGHIVQSIGSSPDFSTKMVRAGDGSEPLHTVAVDSTGRVYTLSWGNPGELVRYSSDLKSVSLRGGEYKFADYWSPNAVYTPIAIDANDKVWLAAPGSPDERTDKRHHSRGWVLRVRPDFLDPSMRVKTFDTRLLGLRPRIEVELPYSIEYEVKPATFQLVLPAAHRMIDQLSVKYVAYDMYKKQIDQGSFDLKLEQDKEVKAPFTITPPAFGWYTVECQLINGGQVLTTLGEHMGVTPAYKGMVKLAPGESKGGWEDAPRQMFVGLSNMRLHPGPGLDAAVDLANKYGATVFVQITSNPKDLTPEFVKPLFEKFKGRVKYWEVINEPNFSISPEKLEAVYAWLYPMLKKIDPQAQVMGPAVCGVILPWHEKFFEAGGAKYLDILSVHDYEGNESVDLYHWRWKFAALRALMTKYGIGDKPIWQTERVLTGVRGHNSLFATQAVRTTFHRDMLQTLGIPPEHDNLYYLNQGGYTAVPSYIWSNNGPHPAAMALRTRYALTMDQSYQGTLDFGPTGNDIYLGLRYANDRQTTLVLRNLGTRVQQLTLGISGGSQPLTVFDAFGNQSSVPVQEGKVTLPIGQMPTYVRLAAGQEAIAPRIDFGRNIASSATFSYSGPHTGEFGWLTNGIMESFHSGSPWGGTGGKFIWRGALTVPQTLEMAFDQPRTIDRVCIYGVRADNAWCALRDYDLDYFDGQKWVTIEQVRLPIPESSAAHTAGAVANTWYQDNNFFVHRFKPVTTAKLRMRVLRTTQGFVPDDRTTSWDSVIPQQLQLREIRIYSPHQPVELAASISPDARPERPDREPVTLELSNRSQAAVQGKVKLLSPEGWSIDPAEAVLAAPAGQTATQTAHLIPPPVLAAGYTPVNLALTDASGQVVDVTTAGVSVAPPARLEPAAPEAVANGPATLSVTVVNTGKQPISGSVQVRMEGPRPVDAAQAAFGPVDGGKRLTVHLPVSGVDLASERWTARYEATINHIRVTSEAQDLAIRPWLVLGPMPHDAADPLAGHTTVDVDFSNTDQMGNELKWRPVPSNAEGLVNLLTIAPQQKEEVWAYAYTLVRSPTDRQAILAVGADDTAEVSLNGQPVLVSKGNARRLGTQKPVHLKAGWNEVLIRSSNAKGNWGFYCDLLGEDGKPIKDVAWATRR